MIDVAHLAERLRSLAEELDEIALDRLREASAHGEVERPRGDKRLMQARRAIEKAAHLLDDVDA
ncbi:hypothetical protein [Ilumatobacter sp.]|uniref:hypothetical protein n=1 Tax=Ilumatobacter sp. TaxID=1967498 RepID=UPI003B52BE54